MKQFLLFLLALMPFTLSAQTKAGSNFTISGKLKNMKDTGAWVYLFYVVDNNRVTDSAEVKNGRYRLSGQISEPLLSRLSIKYNEPVAGNSQQINSAKDIVTVFLSPGKLRITSVDSFSNIRVKGSAAHTDYKAFEQLIKPYNDSMKSLASAYNQFRNDGNEEQMKTIEERGASLGKIIKEDVFETFIKSHPASPVSLVLLQQYAGNDINFNEIEPLYKQLSATLKAYPSALQFKERIDIAQRTSIGQMAADFTRNDTLGNPVSLSSFRGKYVLVDFWASWCGPCRVENPNVVNAFNKYKDKGFTVLGVSLDRPGGKAAWLKAIRDDQLSWTQVSDLQFWNNAAAKLYGIQAIPQNLLLDPSGTIIDKNLRGQDLLNKLEELLGGKQN